MSLETGEGLVRSEAAICQLCAAVTISREQPAPLTFSVPYEVPYEVPKGLLKKALLKEPAGQQQSARALNLSAAMLQLTR